MHCRMAEGKEEHQTLEGEDETKVLELEMKTEEAGDAMRRRGSWMKRKELLKTSQTTQKKDTSYHYSTYASLSHPKVGIKPFKPPKSTVGTAGPKMKKGAKGPGDQLISSFFLTREPKLAPGGAQGGGQGPDQDQVTDRGAKPGVGQENIT